MSIPLRLASLFALPAVLLAACTTAGPTAAPTTAAATQTSAAPQPSPTAAPAPGSAWNDIGQQLQQSNGVVSTQTALQAFSLAFGPMPGVTLPTGAAGSILDGSAPVAWLRAHWQDITAEQRAAAVELVPELAGVPPTWLPTVTQSATPSATAHADRAIVPAALRIAPTPTPTGQQRSNEFYTQYARAEVGQLATRVGIKPTLTVYAHVGKTYYSTSDADTLLLDSKWTFTDPGTICSITISPQGDKNSGEDFADMMSHEAWHCIQDQFLTMAQLYASDRPSWILEGQAAWVGVTLHPGSSRAAGFWQPYLDDPTYALFSRTYDAMGFYFQLAQNGVDVWTHLVPMVQAGANTKALAVSGADNSKFLDQWASGYARDPSRGADWDITGSGIPASTPKPVALSVGDGATVAASAEKIGSNQLYSIDDSSTDILITSFAGHARISNGAGTEYTLTGGQTTLCHKTDGCECPDQGPPPVPTLPLISPNILLAVSGGLTGLIGTVTGMSLDNFCKKTGLTGTWHGNWAEVGGHQTSGSFTVIWTQKGNTVSGSITITGSECVSNGTVTGTVKGNTLSFGAVQAQRVITYNGTYTTKTMSGTFSAPKCGEAVGNWSAHR